MQPADKSRYYLKAAVVGGVVAGVLSGLPGFMMVNCLCVWLLGAGLAAVYLVKQWSGLVVAPGEGAKIGVMAGIVQGVVAFVVFLPFASRQGPSAAELQQLPDGVRQVMEPIARSGTGPAVGFVMSVLSGAAFGALGGLLGSAILTRRR
jgi:hypothetical protein